jgi:hypothetical protein
MDRRNPTKDPIDLVSEKNLWLNLSNEVLTGIAKAKDLERQRNRNAFIELEIQFGTFTQPRAGENLGRFGSYVTRSEFYRVMKYMKQISGNTYEENVIEDWVDGNERISKNYNTGKTTYYDKVKVWNTFQVYFDKKINQYNVASKNGYKLAEDFNLRINISNEFEFKSESKEFKEKVIRNKNRTSFTIDQIGTLDLTEATEIYPSGQRDEKKSTQTKYEIELELYNYQTFLNHTNKIHQFCQTIRRVIQDSEIPYTNSEKTKMYQYVSNLLNIKDGRLRFSLLPEARDLKLEDMVYGGLVGNEKTQYCVTFKADGIRRLIVFMPTQIWAIMPGTPDASLIYRFIDSKDGNTVPPYKPGYIVDGELLSKEHRKDTEPSKWMFYIFDCLVENNQDIRSLPYHERMEMANQMTQFPFFDVLLNQTIVFVVKGYKIISGVNHFFETMKLMFYQEDELPYIHDGLMFIPVQTPYNIYDDPDFLAPPIFDRTLTQFPDICKWKPQNLRSIDFLVEYNLDGSDEKKFILKTGGKDDKDKTPVVFQGSDSYPLNNRIDIDHPILSNLPSHSIVEFFWDERKQLLVPMRVRTDKIAPNRYFTAMNVWKNIFTGIDKETLKGNTFQLMRAYHNKIKLNLFQNTKYTRGHKVLLDIGSGRGGDIKKWNKFDMIFAVEPNPEHIKELQSRLSVSPMKNKVIIIQAGGEDYQKITQVIQERLGERVSTVSLMLSFSFFHGKAREGLKKTIEQNLEMGGEVLILTINGDLVKEMFVPSSGEYEEKSLQFLDAKTTYEPKSGKLYIDIPSTIVKEQEEVPPKLSELFEEWDNFLPLNVSRADKQKFLNLDEKAFSNMYTSFRMILLPHPRSEIEIERIVPYDNVNNSDLFGISILPSDYFYLSAILKATNELYQNNNQLEFRREMVLKVWEEIESELSREEKEKYQFPWNDSILELFSKIFSIQILVIQDKRKRIFGRQYNHKIIIVGEYLLAKSNLDGLLQTVF